jgi:hypothetical protein
MIDDIAEERIRRAKALEEDFPGSRNVPSTGLRVSQTYVQKAEDKPTPDAGEFQRHDMTTSNPYYYI